MIIKRFGHRKYFECHLSENTSSWGLQLGVSSHPLFYAGKMMTSPLQERVVGPKAPFLVRRLTNRIKMILRIYMYVFPV